MLVRIQEVIYANCRVHVEIQTNLLSFVSGCNDVSCFTLFDVSFLVCLLHAVHGCACTCVCMFTHEL